MFLDKKKHTRIGIILGDYLPKPLNTSINQYFLVPLLTSFKCFKSFQKTETETRTLKIKFLLSELELEPEKLKCSNP